MTPKNFVYGSGPLRVELKPLPDRCHAVLHWHIDDANTVQQQALARALQDYLRRDKGTVMVDSHRSQQVLDWCLDHGFKALRLKYLYEKRLDSSGVQLEVFQFKSLAQLGTADFLAYMVAAATDDPEASALSDPEAEFQELLAHADSAFDPHDWFVAFQKDEAVGVVLPQVFADKPSEGTLSYIGVLPAQRGKGLGAKLHLWGLEQLRQRGVIRYIGSTGSTNHAMQRIFIRNGCTEIAARHFVGPPVKTSL